MNRAAGTLKDRSPERDIHFPFRYQTDQVFINLGHTFSQSGLTVEANGHEIRHFVTFRSFPQARPSDSADWLVSNWILTSCQLYTVDIVSYLMLNFLLLKPCFVIVFVISCL